MSTRKADDLVEQVEFWFKKTGLADIKDSRGQFLKLMEESGEMAGAYARGQQEKFVDGAGDVMVVVIGILLQQGSSFEEALTMVLEIILKRKLVVVDGVAIKEEDWSEEHRQLWVENEKKHSKD
jgi:phosphoribosyl-ATP pyrophosphohydrolase